jgi:hypothetical protein
VTRNENMDILRVISAAYPQFLRNLESAGVQLAEAVGLWADLFADDPAALVAAAVKALIADRYQGLPASIGAVREQMAKILAGGRRNDRAGGVGAGAARALKRHLRLNQEYARLPETIQAVLGEAKTLHNWRQYGDVDTVIASNFMRSYGQRRACARYGQAARGPSGDDRPARGKMASPAIAPPGMGHADLEGGESNDVR